MFLCMSTHKVIQRRQFVSLLLLQHAGLGELLGILGIAYFRRYIALQCSLKVLMIRPTLMMSYSSWLNG